MYTRYLLFWLISYCFAHSSAYADCPTPHSLNVYNITYQSASFSWYSTYSTSPPTYQLQWRVAGSTNWNTNPVTSSSLSLTGLTNNTAYEWRVRAICAAGDTSAYAIGTAFQTKCDPPTYLTVSNVMYESAQLAWNQPVYGATYEVQWRPAGTTTWTVVSNITTGYLRLTGLTDQTPYEWQVRTVCSGTAVSDFVTGAFFQTRCLPPTNTRTSLINPDAAEVRWESSVANVLYDLRWQPVGSSSWTVVEGITAKEYILAGLSNATDYVWQVRTACSATSKSAYSDAQYFRTTCPGPPTSLITSSLTYNTAVLTWTGFASELQWRASGAADWTTVSNARSPYTLTSLTTNTTYEWRVRTICSAAAASAYTPSQLFTTQCFAPTNAYANSNQLGGFDVAWNASDDGPFEVQWRVSGAASWSMATGIMGRNYRLTGLMAQTSYDWRVRRVCSATDYSAFATGSPVQPTCAVPTYTQNGSATSSSITLYWEAGVAGTRYELQWRTSGSADWTTVTGISAYQYTLTGLQSGVQYEWRVRKVCSADLTSAYTPTQTFTLLCLQPGYFYANTIDASSAIISWNGSSGTIYPPYDVQYRPLGATNWTAIPAVTTNQYSLTGLINNTTYEWRVRASCSASESAFSTVQTFQTQCPAPTGLTVTNINFNTARLNWQNNSVSKPYEIQYRESGSTDWITVRPEGAETDSYFGQPTYNLKSYPLYNLSLGKTYEWRIRTLCTASIYSDYVFGPAFTTTCFIPQGLAASQLTTTSLQLYWASSTATYYELQWRTTGATDWNTIGNLTSNTYILTGLAPGGRYEYRIRQQCSPSVMSDYSATYTAQLQCLSPYIASSQTLSASSVRLQWAYSSSNVDPSTSTYELQYRTVGAQNWTSLTGIVGSTYSLTGLTTGTLYEARVRATCTPGLQTDFSGPSAFSVNCPVPFANVYNVQIGSTFANLFWSANSLYSYSFLLQWRVAGTTAWTNVTVAYPGQTYVSTIPYVLTGLTNNTTYEWRVATNCGDYLSDFSTVQSFLTACPPVQSLATKNVGSTSAQLSWSGTNLTPDLAFTVQYRISGRVVWSELSGVASMSALLTGLAPNTLYEWRIRTECGSGNATDFSASITFTTQCPNPTNLSALNVTMRAAQLVWVSSSENTFVNLRWRAAFINAAWNTVNGLTSSTFALTRLTSGTYYEYQLQGVCSAENQGTNTTWANSGFTTLYTTALALNVDSVFAQGARLTWSGGPDRTNYVLQWRIQNGAWNTSGPVATKRYLLTGLMPNSTYEVRLSYTDENAITYQATSTFGTNCSRATDFKMDVISFTEARLSWSGANIPVTLQWRVAGTTAWNSVMGVTTSSYSLTGLTGNITYEWRLLTPCWTGYPNAFRTDLPSICPTPTSAYTQSVSTESALLAWTGTGSGRAYTLQYRVAGTTNWTTLSNLTSTTVVLTGLTNNTTYEWAVGTVCEANSSIMFTNTLPFRTQCSVPTNLFVSRIASDWVELSWNKSGPTSQLQWRVVGQTTWNDRTGVTAPYTLTGLTPGLTYEWRVRSTCLAEADGVFSYGATFTPQCYTYYAEHTETITPRSARLVWSATPPSSYGIRWRVLGSNTWNVVSGNVITPYFLTGLANNTLYEWQLRTVCQPDYGASQVFQTHCNSPINLQTEALTSNSVALRWNDPGDGVGYKVRWRLAGTATWNTATDVTSTSYSLQGLANFTAYEWQVGSQCANDESDFQLTASFKTIDANACPQGMYTIRVGSWDDPTVWSCNRLPTVTDAVQIKHMITVQPNYVAKAHTISYDSSGQLAVGAGAIIQMGN